MIMLMIIYSETLPYGHLVITATLFGHLAKTVIHILVKKTLVNMANFIWPIGDSINGIPL